MSMQADPASYKDNAGRVFIANDCVYRGISAAGLQDYHAVRETGLIDTLIEQGDLLAENTVDAEQIAECDYPAELFLQHPKLDFISYPYEWSFSALQQAALFHLRIHQQALAYGVNLVDASAYNIQFQGIQPIFIDHLSFRPYRQGEFWLAHKQFCEQFLNPLLLTAYCGIPFNYWYRGNPQGIPTQDVVKLIPLYKKFNWSVLCHVVLQASFQKQKNQDAAKVKAAAKLPLKNLQHLLASLSRWIEGLKPSKKLRSQWQGYTQERSYRFHAIEAKQAFVQAFIEQEQINTLWDMGCNTGEYAAHALAAGAQRVIGFDMDHGCLEHSFKRAQKEKLNFTPIFHNIADPSPGQGWSHQEHKSLTQRVNADGVLALAIIHHLAISQNIPLPRIVDWLIQLAPKGVVEFVPKQDPMVQTLLCLREDIFADYKLENMINYLQAKATIIKTEAITESGRTLIWYQV